MSVIQGAWRDNSPISSQRHMRVDPADPCIRSSTCLLARAELWSLPTTMHLLAASSVLMTSMGIMPKMAPKSTNSRRPLVLLSDPVCFGKDLPHKPVEQMIILSENGQGRING